jgi:hypothetical protein
MRVREHGVSMPRLVAWADLCAVAGECGGGGRAAAMEARLGARAECAHDRATSP